MTSRTQWCFFFPLSRVVPRCSGVRVPGHRRGGPRECCGDVTLTQGCTSRPSEPRRSASMPDMDTRLRRSLPLCMQGLHLVALAAKGLEAVHESVRPRPLSLSRFRARAMLRTEPRQPCSALPPALPVQAATATHPRPCCASSTSSSTHTPSLLHVEVSPAVVSARRAAARRTWVAEAATGHLAPLAGPKPPYVPNCAKESS
jgi:hypothetical protein